jgi:hypothetical protein
MLNYKCLIGKFVPISINVNEVKVAEEQNKRI